MTFLQLQQLVSYYLDDLNFGYFTPTQVKLWLNNAQKEVQKRLLQAGQNYYVECVQTTLVYGQKTYALPDNFKELNRLEIVTQNLGSLNETTTPVLPITLNQVDLTSTLAGVPQFYYIKRNNLVLVPVPNVTYPLRLNYSYAVGDMLNDSDTPDVPEQYHELIALIAAEDGFLKDGRASELLTKRLAEFKLDMDRDAAERNVDVPRRVVETGADSGGGFFW